MAAAGGGSAGFVFAATEFPSDTSGQYYHWVNQETNQNFAYKSNGNVVVIWRNRYGSTANSKVNIAEIDTNGDIVNSRQLSGYIRGSTGLKIGAGVEGHAICVDDSDDVYIGAGTGDGAYIAKLSSDLQSITWDNVIYGFAQYVNGIGINPTTGRLWVKSVDFNNLVNSFNASTGANTGQFRDYSSSGITQEAEWCLAYWGGDNQVSYGVKANLSGYPPAVYRTSPESTGVGWHRINGYSGATSNYDAPYGVATDWKVGDTGSTLRNLFVTGRQNRSGSRIFYVTEVNKYSTQLNNGYFPQVYPDEFYIDITPPAVDKSGNCYFLVAKYDETKDRYGKILVKLDSSFNVSNALEFIPITGTGRTLDINRTCRNTGIALNQDDTFVAFPLHGAVSSNQNRYFGFVSLTTDLDTVSAGTYDLPIQSGVYAGEQFEIRDRTSDVSADFITETSTATFNISVSGINISGPSYATAPTTAALSGTNDKTTL